LSEHDWIAIVANKHVFGLHACIVYAKADLSAPVSSIYVL